MGRTFDGSCRLCGDTYTGTGISSHVKRCLTDHADIAAVHHGLLVGLRADGPAGRYWMYVLVRPEARLAELDTFLREVWFETDATASGFSIEGTQYLSRLDDPDDETEDVPVESMDVDLGAVLRPRMEGTYTYDPREPTTVELTVFDPYPCPESLVDDGSIGAATLVARNDIEDAECSTCGAPADQLCANCLQEDESPSDDEEEPAEAEDSEEPSPDDSESDPDEADDEADEVGPLVCDDCLDRHAGPFVAIENTPRSGRRIPSDTTPDE